LLVLVFKEASLFLVSSNVFDLVIEFGGMSLFVIEFSLVVLSREARVFFNGYTPPLFIWLCSSSRKLVLARLLSFSLLFAEDDDVNDGFLVV
jgi:hypothetical protein